MGIIWKVIIALWSSKSFTFNKHNKTAKKFWKIPIIDVCKNEHKYVNKSAISFHLLDVFSEFKMQTLSSDIASKKIMCGCLCY